MHSDDIAPDVRELINRHLRSMDHAEALLHLVDAPRDAHGLDAIAFSHRWTRGVAAQVMSDLVDTGIALQSDAGFTLASDATDGQSIARLAELYHRHPVKLVRAIYAAPFPIRPLIRPTHPDSARPSSL